MNFARQVARQYSVVESSAAWLGKAGNCSPAELQINTVRYDQVLRNGDLVSFFDRG